MIKKIGTFLRNEFLPFCIIGSIGFLIDTGIFSIVHLEFPSLPSRMISILCAMTFTWISNRTFTFKTQKKIRHAEWISYFTINALSALINLSVFLLLIRRFIFLSHFFVIAIAISTLVSMWFNFFMFKYYVFKQR